LARDNSKLTLAERVYRAHRIGTTFGRIYLGAKSNQWIERVLRPSDMKRRWSKFNRDSAEAIYETATELRGLILKGCQFVGSRADVLPPEYIEVLSRLQDRVPPREFSVVQRIVDDELGRPIDEIFEWFSPDPIASASLAQVHAARLRGGEPVAVKVQYPEIPTLVRSDLGNLRTLFRAVGIVERNLDLMPLIDELSTYVPRELDFIAEGENAEKVASFFKGRDDLHVPSIRWEYTTRRVLVMERIEGIKISDTDALRAAGVDPTHLMQTLIEAYCEQILVHGFFHADPHPGNLMVQPSRAEGEPDRLVFLDFGLAKDLPPEFREGIVAFAAAMLTGKSDDMAHALVDLGFETRDGSTDSLREITRIVLDVATRLRKQSFVDPKLAKQASEDLPRLVRENPIVRMPSHVVLLGRVIGLLSGLGRTLDAKVDMLRTILPYAMKMPNEPTAPSPPRATEPPERTPTSTSPESD